MIIIIHHLNSGQTKPYQGNSLIICFNYPILLIPKTQMGYHLIILGYSLILYFNNPALLIPQHNWDIISCVRKSSQLMLGYNLKHKIISLLGKSAVGIYSGHPFFIPKHNFNTSIQYVIENIVACQFQIKLKIINYGINVQIITFKVKM